MRAARLILILASALAVAACGGSHTPSASSSPGTASATQTASPTQPAPATKTARASIQVSSDFTPGGLIPRRHTCDGQDVSPPLRATGIPPGTRELVVVMVDHDAGDFMHWGIAHLTPRASEVPPGAKPAGAVLGRNGFGSLGYRGPCPPAGDGAHHYEITVYALSRPSMLKPGFSAGAVAGLPVLAIGSLSGRYARH
jgi:Raf kinase inhibitor-like YbhB/YbcL family protein